MLISIVIIVGAALGIIVFNSILVTWCLFCQRKQGAKQTIARQKNSSGKHVKFAASVMKGSRNKYASYPASRQRQGPPPPHVPSPLASAKVRTRRSDRPRAENLFTIMPTIYAPSVWSDDTASVYSAASAPLETHDYLLRSHNSQNIIPVTSASSTSERLSLAVTSPKDAELMVPSWAGNRLSNMEEGLGPEACNRSIQHPTRQVDHWRRQQRSASCILSRDQSAWGQTPDRLLPPGLLVSPSQHADNTGQGLSSTPMPSPYSPPPSK
ncbi:hypothetical protein BYT27DRAFT_7334799 [Phlegmacium glaucopus]|nr:hypothetical protein BYT27DRAFT_7334799 [Phlegmacium glaucopus]